MASRYVNGSLLMDVVGRAVEMIIRVCEEIFT
jgi:hypothetical protein